MAQDRLRPIVIVSWLMAAVLAVIIGTAVLERVSAGARRAAPVEVATGRYTCPMHPEVVSDAPGACPKCGMPLVAQRVRR